MAKVNPIQAQKFLGGMDYPDSKDEIVRCTEQNGADENVTRRFAPHPGQAV